MKPTDIVPMPRCLKCKVPMEFVPKKWKMGHAKNVQCVNPNCPPPAPAPDHIQRERDRTAAKSGKQ